MFLLRCPKCKNNQKYQARDAILATKSKRCVYCGRSFRVKDHILKKL